MRNCVGIGNVVAGVICADGHLGYAQPVGGVIAYEKQISISGVGFDIGLRAVQLDTPFTAIEDRVGAIGAQPSHLRLAREPRRARSVGRSQGRLHSRGRRRPETERSGDDGVDRNANGLRHLAILRGSSQPSTDLSARENKVLHGYQDAGHRDRTECLQADLDLAKGNRPAPKQRWSSARLRSEKYDEGVLQDDTA
jgi:hypothetical protein